MQSPYETSMQLDCRR